MKNMIRVAVAAFLPLAAMAQQPEPAFLPAQLDTIAAHARAAGFSGIIQVRQGDRTVFSFANGSTRSDGGRPIDADTRFNIGSANKTMTALLVLQLAAAGKVQLDAPIARYLRGVDSVPNGGQITVRQLLSHTAGLGDFFESPGFREEAMRNTDAVFPVVQRAKPTGAPGGDFSYSNSGFIVLGKLLERLTGTPYDKLVAKRVLQPAGIVSGAPVLVATGYRQEGGQWVPGEGNDPSRWTAAGGLFLSVNELHRYMHRVAQGGYLPANWRDTMWTNTAHPKGDPPFVHYALGWMAEQPAGLQLYGHNGGLPGFQVAFRYLPQQDLYLYVLSNHGDGAEPIFMELIMALIGRRQQGPVKP